MSVPPPAGPPPGNPAGRRADDRTVELDLGHLRDAVHPGPPTGPDPATWPDPAADVEPDPTTQPEPEPGLPTPEPDPAVTPDPLPAPVAAAPETGPIPVDVVDTPTARVHHPSDLVTLVLCALGILGVLLLTVFAHSTTTGVQEDVQNFNSVLARILVVPVALLEGLVTIVVPVAVLIELGVRKLGRQVLESLAAGALGLVLSVATYLSLREWASPELLSGLSVGSGSDPSPSIPGYVGAISALLTTAGPRTRRRMVRLSWNLLWVSLGVVVVTGQVSLPGVLVTVLLGRIAGLAVRYLSGVQSERAYGEELIAGVRRAGFAPVSLVRVTPSTDDPGPTPAAGAPGWAGHRAYTMTTADHGLLDVVVLDGDRQVLGFLTRLWRSVRLRGIDGRTAMSLRAVAERGALMALAAHSAGVRTPRLLGVAEAADSMLLIQERTDGAVPLRDLDAEGLDDALLHEAWRQLTLAHTAGLAHRSLTSQAVRVTPAEDAHPGGPTVWLTDWESGDIASSELARRMDLAQMLALLAVRVGAQRAIASAAAVLPDGELAAIGPLLQTIVLPQPTREELRRNRSVLGDLRKALVELMPAADVEPERLVRFEARKVIMLVLTIVAVSVVITTINFQQIMDAFRGAAPWWVAVCFALGLVTWLGAAVTLVAFSPIRLPLFRATLTQAASSFVALAAPAGIGPAALNLRMLTRRGVGTSVAVATVALVQASQFVMTVLVLVVLFLVTGDSGVLRGLPSASVLGALALVAIAVAATMLVPAVRRWVLAKVTPILQQTWPRLSEVLGQPSRLAWGMLGNVGMTLAYVFAFDAALEAFGYDVALVDVAVIYLIGNALGAAAPTPGGLGTIETALIVGLTSTAGVPTALATSVTVLFRAMTYWARIPLGWLAMRYLQRVGDL